MISEVRKRLVASRKSRTCDEVVEIVRDDHETDFGR